MDEFEMKEGLHFRNNDIKVGGWHYDEKNV